MQSNWTFSTHTCVCKALRFNTGRRQFMLNEFRKKLSSSQWTIIDLRQEYPIEMYSYDSTHHFRAYRRSDLSKEKGEIKINQLWLVQSSVALSWLIYHLWFTRVYLEYCVFQYSQYHSTLKGCQIWNLRKVHYEISENMQWFGIVIFRMRLQIQV